MTPAVVQPPLPMRVVLAFLLVLPRSALTVNQPHAGTASGDWLHTELVSVSSGANFWPLGKHAEGQDLSDVLARNAEEQSLGSPVLDTPTLVPPLPPLSLGDKASAQVQESGNRLVRREPVAWDREASGATGVGWDSAPAAVGRAAPAVLGTKHTWARTFDYAVAPQTPSPQGVGMDGSMNMRMVTTTTPLPDVAPIDKMNMRFVGVPTPAPANPIEATPLPGNATATAGANNATSEGKDHKGESDFDYRKQTGIPAWAVVIIGASTSAVLVFIMSKLGDMMANRSRPIPTEAERIQAELDEARQRAQALTDALEAQRLEEERARQAEAAARGEAAAAAAAEAAAQAEATYEELLGEMHARTRGLEQQLAGGLGGVVNQAAPILARASQVQTVFQEGVSQIRGRAESVARQEAAELLTRVHEAMGVDNPALPPWLVHLQRSAIEGPGGSGLPNFKIIPPLGLLVAGSLAPMQMASMEWNAQFSIYWNGMVMAMCGGIAAVEWYKPCSDKLAWIWLLGMGIFAFLLVVLNAFVHGQARVGVLETEADARRCATANTGNGVWDTFMSLQNGSGFFFRALFRYDKIVRHWSYTCSKLGGLLYTVWGGFGVHIAVQDIIADTERCKAKALMFFLHTCSFFYLLLFTWILMGFVIWLVFMLSSSTFVSGPIIRLAKSLDDANPLKLPIFLSIVRTLVLRGSSDMLAMQQEDLQNEIRELEKESAEMEAKLAYMKREAERVAAERAAATTEEDRLIQHYEQTVSHGLNEVAPLVALAAAGVEEQGGAGALGGLQDQMRQRLDAASPLLDQARAAAANLGDSEGMASLDVLRHQVGSSMQQQLQASGAEAWGQQAFASAQQQLQASGAMEAVQQRMDPFAPMMQSAQQQLAAGLGAAADSASGYAASVSSAAAAPSAAAAVAPKAPPPGPAGGMFAGDGAAGPPRFQGGPQEPPPAPL